MKNENTMQEMGLIEQTLQNLLFQKQAFELEFDETSSALKEIEKSGDEVFKIIGQMMIKTEKSDIKKELLEKQKILGMRIKSFEKQESYLREKMENLQQETSDASKK